MRRRRKNFPAKYAAVLAAAAFVLAVAYSPGRGGEEEPPFRREISTPYHAHADFLVVINGKEMDFNRPEYDAADPRIHLHLGNYMGDKVLHIESREASLDDFFASIGITLTRECFAFVEGDAYCSNETRVLGLYVNGEKNGMFEDYKPQDLDRILIIYGDESEEEIKSWADNVSGFACVFSLTCEPPEEALDKIIYN